MNAIISYKVRKIAKGFLPFYLFALLPFMTSCSDFLEIEPLNEIVLENFWNEKADVNDIIAGCYSGMQSDAMIRRMIIWGEARSENIGAGLNSTDDANLLNVLNENIMATNGYTSWDGFYNIINRCNTVIKYAPQVAANDPSYTESELQANIAEMVALRSLCYFYLIRTFRDVPYSTEAFTDDDQKFDLPATKFDAVLDSLINDLERVKDQAVKYYPTTTPLYQTGRITQDAIHAMLCEMYLWKKDYQKCIYYADLVINSKKTIAENIIAQGGSLGYYSGTTGSSTTAFERYNGYPLVSEVIMSGLYGNAYSTLFGYDVESERAQARQEIVFQLVFKDDPTGNSMPANSAINTFYGNASVARGYLAPSDYLLDDIAKESGRTIFADKNKNVDARMYENCNKLFKSINKYTTSSVQISAAGTSSSPSSIAYFNMYSDGNNGANWVIYRLTDIMLLKAEALTQTMREGSDNETIAYNTPILAQAFSLVNAINKRAVCQATLQDTLVATDYSTKAQMEELVLKERQRELMFEGKRWYDLVRRSQRDGNTQTLVNAALRKVTSGGSLIQNKLTKMDAIYWPYNNDEIKVNKNLVQNPAFSSGEDNNYQKTN